MSVEKMYFVNISGPKDELDSFVLNYIIPHEIQLVKAFSILDTVKGLFPYNEENPYEPILRKMDNIGIKPDKSLDGLTLAQKSIDLNSVRKTLDVYEDEIGHIKVERDQLMVTKQRKEKILHQILPIKDLDIEVDELFKFKHMKFRFGKMPVDSFSKLQTYVEKVEIIVYEVFEEDGDVFLVYFTPDIYQETIDSLFASLYFTRIRISGEVKGYPKDALEALEKELEDINSRLNVLEKELDAYFNVHRKELTELYAIIESLNQVFSVRSFAAHSKEAFFLTGWITATNLDSFDQIMIKKNSFTHLVEEDDAVMKVTPPTKLKNIGFFKPFEALVSMYGIPSYTEMDPTVFVGITYMLMFGLMFGDIGQGLALAVGGFLLYKFKDVKLGILGVYLGVVSMLTGMVYGSVFGNEEFLRHLFPKIPFVNAMESENMILVLGGTIGIGVVIMIVAMIFNVYNAYKNRNYGRLLFDKNGIIGLVFYTAILFIALNILFSADGIGTITVVVPAIIIGISLIMILLSHPLQNYINKKRKIFPDEKVGFFIESTFEVVEVVLAVLSNTISFMRIGAFAMNHVGFSLAFQILSDMVAESGGSIGGIVVMIVGNIIIIGLEGMIVAIQCMRLEYYELFSRFFEGKGVKYEPFTVKVK